MTTGLHPSDADLAAWVDEPETCAAPVAAHIQGCTACGARIRELNATRAALALDPPLPSDAAFAAQRERILAAIGRTRDRDGGGRVVRRIGWIATVAAAAAIAALVVLGRDGRRSSPSPSPVPAVVVDVNGLPLLADAREAAEEAAAVLVPAATADASTPEASDDALDAALAAVEPLAPPSSLELSMTTESRFAALAEEEQDAVLLELADADFGF